MARLMERAGWPEGRERAPAEWRRYDLTEPGPWALLGLLGCGGVEWVEGSGWRGGRAAAEAERPDVIDWG